MESKRARYTVAEAAGVLGITEAAVRARINRGKLRSEKVENTVYVWLDPDATPVNHHDQGPLIEALRDQVSTLKQQLNTEQAASAELRRIIAALTSRIPELEAPQSREDAPESTAEPGQGVEEPQPEHLSWWRRMFQSR